MSATLGVTSTSRALQLPAPTDLTGFALSDVATNISTRTDKTSFSVPDDGRELHISRRRGPNMSQASLLIEYYEGGKSSKSGQNTRPSVRVKVRPSSKHGMSTANNAVKITQMGRNAQPLLIKSIPLDGIDKNIQLNRVEELLEEKSRQTPEAQAVAGSELTQSSDSHPSGRQPLEVEILNNSSDLSSGRVLNASEISSMPAESTLDAPLRFEIPQHRRSPSFERESKVQDGLLKPPMNERDRSLSREREHIAQRVIDQLHAERALARTRKLQKVGDMRGRELAEADLKSRSRHSTSKNHNDSDMRSPDGLSLFTREVESNISGTSRSSVNNPKVIRAVEDAIRRLILPEIEKLKRNQSLNHRSNRDSLASGSSGRTEPVQRASKLLEDSVLRRERRHSSRTESDRSADTMEHGKRGARKSLGKESTRRRELGLEGLTAEALRTHNINDAEKQARERRMRRSKNEGGGSSTSNTEKEYHEFSTKIPPMPMKSELVDSERTRESILSVETADSDVSCSGSPGRPDHVALHEVSRARPSAAQQEPRSPSRTPHALSPPYSRPLTRQTVVRASSATPTPRKMRISSSESVKTELSIKTKAKNAGLAAAGLGSAAMAALYHQHDRGLETDERARSRQSQRSARRTSREDSMFEQVLAHGQTVSRPTSRSMQPERTDQHALELSADEAFARAEEANPIVLESRSRKEEENAKNQETFYEEQHRINDEYRSFTDSKNTQDSSMFGTTNSSAEKQVKDVAVTPHVVSGPIEVESAVASLLGPSLLSTEAPSLPRPANYAPAGSESPSVRSEDSPTRPYAFLSTQHDNRSRERWALLRETARAVSLNSSRETSPDKPRTPIKFQGDDAQDSTAESRLTPLLLRGGSDESIRRPQPQAVTHTTSWPISSDPQALQQLQDLNRRHFDSPDIEFDTQLRHDVSTDSKSEESMQRSVFHYDGAQDHGREKQDVSNPAARALDPIVVSNGSNHYVTGKQSQPVHNYTPPSFAQGGPRLFDNVDLALPASNLMDLPGKEMSNVLTVRPREHNREYSGNSHDAKPMYDAATGNGINHIKSKDIVALMDHLAARDGQRSARDTEILVTLVRSAAEMRESVEGMKKFIEQQNHINMERTDMDADKVVNKILSGPRPPPVSTSQAKRPTHGSLDPTESPTKKTNIFRRALKGLGNKSTTDLTHIEDMLMQLLDEVEALRDDRGITKSTPGPLRPQRPDSLNSYERLRAGLTLQADFDAYGRPLTTSGPRKLDQPASQSVYAPAANNFYAQEEDSAGDRTPTQERPDPLNSHRVEQEFPRPSVVIDPTSLQDVRRQKHASASSSFPFMSRWSKTTASTSQDNRNSLGTQFPSKSLDSPQESDKDVSHQICYSLADDDRLPRSPSSLLPISISAALNPKYHANRKSLDLEHPQPRKASTGRHQDHLENQATSYAESDHSPLLSSDVFGSHPSLGRLAAQYGISTSTGTAAPPVTTTLGWHTNVNIDSVQHDDRKSADSPNEESLLYGPSPTAASSKNMKQDHPPTNRAYYVSPSPSPQPASNPTTDSAASSPTSLRHHEAGLSLAARPWQDTRIPTPQRVGPYQAGELLNPIEERYSLEGDRSSLGYRDSTKSKRGQRSSVLEAASGDVVDGEVLTRGGSVRSRRTSMADVREEDEDDAEEYDEALQRRGLRPQDQGNYTYSAPVRTQTDTPKLSPRPALGVPEFGAAAAGVRKLTGPREMPGSPASPRLTSASSLIAGTNADAGRAGPLRGTVRRKPVS